MGKRRIIKAIALTVTAALFSTLLCTCKKKSDDSQAVGGVNDGAKVITTGILNSFSSEMDLYQVLLSEGYGKMTLNKEGEYYKSGSGSAKLWVADNNGTSMIFRHRLESDVYGYDYTNFKKVKSIKTSVYSEAEEDVEVIFALEFADGGKSPIKKYTLQSGWNYLEYAVDREMLSMQFDIEKTMYLSYTFQTNETPYTVYVDEIQLGLTTSEMKEVVQHVEENEICSFDSNYQMAVFSLFNYNAAKMGNFLDFGLTANPERVKNGKSFYVTTKAGMTEDGNSYMLKLNPKYSALIDWKNVTTEDYISFWVYNEGPEMKLDFRVNNTKGKVLVEMDLASETTTRTVLKANAWTEAKISFATIKALADKNGYLKEDEKIGDIITSFDVSWVAFDDVPQKTLYFDEFKIVKGGAQ